MSNYNVTASRFSLPVGDSMPLKGVSVMSVSSSAYDCEFCLNYGGVGEACFCCGAVAPVNDLARLEFLGQRLDILADLLGKATRAEIDGKQEAWDNSFRLASVAVAEEMRELYRKASDEWKAEYDKVRLARGVERLSDSI